MIWNKEEKAQTETVEPFFETDLIPVTLCVSGLRLWLAEDTDWHLIFLLPLPLFYVTF